MVYGRVLWVSAVIMQYPVMTALQLSYNLIGQCPCNQLDRYHPDYRQIPVYGKVTFYLLRLTPAMA